MYVFREVSIPWILSMLSDLPLIWTKNFAQNIQSIRGWPLKILDQLSSINRNLLEVTFPFKFTYRRTTRQTTGHDVTVITRCNFSIRSNQISKVVQINTRSNNILNNFMYHQFQSKKHFSCIFWLYTKQSMKKNYNWLALMNQKQSYILL